MARASRTFRVFVSSTFADLKVERNALQEHVFPRLHEYCLGKGFRFQAVDLRWGVSEEAARDQQTINICLNEIERCRRPPLPNFVVLLGDRYGWCPPPPQIPLTEWDGIMAALGEESDEARELAEWYVPDLNAVPPEWYVKPRTARYIDPEAWKPVERRLRGILEQTLPKVGVIEYFDQLKYLASATHQEIDRGALRVPQEHAFCYFRSIKVDGSRWEERSEGFEDLFARRAHRAARSFFNLNPDGTREQRSDKRLRELKKDLRGLIPAVQVRDGYEAEWIWAAGKDEPPITEYHVGQLCDDVYGDLVAAIDAQMEGFQETDRLTREIEAHEEFGKERAQVFEGRIDELGMMHDYFRGPDGAALVVIGEGGIGKSALLAKAAEEGRGDRPRDVIVRFIGHTPDSSTGRGLLGDICRQLARDWGPSEAERPVPSDFRDLAMEFGERLKLAAESRPLALYIDALDQLSGMEGARSLSWLPSELPPGVAIVVSTTPGDMQTSLESRFRGAGQFVQVGPMERREAQRAIEQWLVNAKPARTLQGPQRDVILDRFEDAGGNPLYLKLVFEEARRWRHDLSVDEIRSRLPGSIGDVIESLLFARLERRDQHGPVLVPHALAYLAAGKNGLTEDEMLGMLTQSDKVWNDFLDHSHPDHQLRERRLPIVIWSRLYFDLEPYLTEKTADEASLMGFYHRQLAEVVKEKYLVGDEGLARHRELARHFGHRRRGDGEQGETPLSLRTMSELPYQETMGELWDDLVKTLTDFKFLEQKAARPDAAAESTDAQGNTARTYMGIYQIRDDYALALDRMPGEGGGRAGARGGRRHTIVTGVDFGKGDGYVLRCPHCNTIHKFQNEWRGAENFQCPVCNGPLKVNTFVVPPRE